MTLLDVQFMDATLAALKSIEKFLTDNTHSINHPELMELRTAIFMIEKQLDTKRTVGIL